MGNEINYVEYTIFYKEEKIITGEFRSSNIKGIIYKGNWLYRVDLYDGTHRDIKADSYRHENRSMNFEFDQLTKELKAAERHNSDLRKIIEKMEEESQNIQEELREIKNEGKDTIKVLLELKDRITS